MSYDYDCRECYKKTLKRIQDYLTDQCKVGESLSAEAYGSYGRECYISIDYDTIIDKKHISKFEHLSPHFMEKSYFGLPSKGMAKGEHAT